MAKTLRSWRPAGAAMAVALALMLGAIPIVAGAQPAQTDTPSEAAVDAVVAQSDDVRALVAPAALYPDPILALVLQASTLPLQVVQAERFLDRRAKDSSLQPNPDWDKSIIGLLNYPRQVELMAEYIDWTEELGNAVVDNLDEVQGSVQEIRLAAYYAGFLKSNKQQKVEVKDEVVRITSTDAQKVSIPQYDPAALLTALDEVEEAEDAADEAVAAPAVPASKAPATPAPQPSPPVAQPAIPAGSASAPMVETVPATPVTYAQPVTAPAIAYGEPEDSFWGDAATFAGGAVVGGLLGWGLTEAFDDDDNDWLTTTTGTTTMSRRHCAIAASSKRSDAKTCWRRATSVVTTGRTAQLPDAKAGTKCAGIDRRRATNDCKNVASTGTSGSKRGARRVKTARRAREKS